MKIGDLQGPASGAAAAAAKPAQNEIQQAAAVHPVRAVGEDSATVQLSATASSLMAGEGADFNAAKVEQVRQAIADGSYRVNAEAIADKMLANAQELLGRTE